MRSLTTTARTRVETFSVQVDDLDDSDLIEPGPVENLVGEFRFRGTVGEPILIWEGVVQGADSMDKALAFFSGNVVREEPRVTTTFKAAGLDPLPDGAFWPVIDRLEGRLWERTLRAAALQLAEQEDEHILRWSETAGVRALALAEVLEAVGVDPGHELSVIGAAIGMGEAAYTRVRADPETFDPRWLSDGSAQVLWLGDHALEHRRGGEVWVETSFSVRQREINHRELEQLEQNRRDRGFPPERHETSYRAARALIQEGAAFRETARSVPR